VITLLIWLLFLCLVMGIAVWIIRLIPLPEPFGTIAIAVLGLIFLLIIVSVLLGDFPLRPLRLNG